MCIRVGILWDGGVEDKDSHGALDAIDGRRHVCVGLFDEHDGGLKLSSGDVLSWYVQSSVSSPDE